MNHYIHTLQFLVESYVAVKKLCILFDLTTRLYPRLEEAWMSDKMANPYEAKMTSHEWIEVADQLERLLSIEWIEDEDGRTKAGEMNPTDIDLVRFR